jgi:hypothetical protein
VDAGAVLNLMIATVALIISTAVAARQLLAAKRAGHVEASWQVLNETCGTKFLSDEQYILAALAKEHSAAAGLSGLPEPVRSDIQRVAYVYQTIGYLSSLGAIDKKMTRYLVGLRVVSVWQSLAPFIEAERNLHGDRVGFRFFEDLAYRCSGLTVERAVAEFRLRSWVAPSG